jgi:hypothetical protein
MTTLHKTALALLASLTLIVSSAAASHPKALLVNPDPYCQVLPKFGFSSFNIAGFGEQVTHVRWNGRAARMGLESGDIILSMNGFPLTYHGAWNDALREAMVNGGLVQLTIRDVRTGHLAYRQTFIGSGGIGPVTPYVVGYPTPKTTYHVYGGPITIKKLAKLAE